MLVFHVDFRGCHGAYRHRLALVVQVGGWQEPRQPKERSGLDVESDACWGWWSKELGMSFLLIIINGSDIPSAFSTIGSRSFVDDWRFIFRCSIFARWVVQLPTSFLCDLLSDGRTGRKLLDIHMDRAHSQNNEIDWNPVGLKTGSCDSLWF